MYQTYQLPAGLLSPTFPGMMHCHNSILDFPPCLLFASLKESVHFSINCIESCLMHSTCILRLCVASFPEMQTFIPGKGIRKTTLGVEAKDVANKCCNRRWNKDFKDLSTFAIICSVLLLQAVAQLHKSTQVKQLEYLEIQVDVAIAVTSNYIIYMYFVLPPWLRLTWKNNRQNCKHEKATGTFPSPPFRFAQEKCLYRILRSKNSCTALWCHVWSPLPFTCIHFIQWSCHFIQHLLREDGNVLRHPIDPTHPNHHSRDPLLKRWDVSFRYHRYDIIIWFYDCQPEGHTLTERSCNSPFPTGAMMCAAIHVPWWHQWEPSVQMVMHKWMHNVPSPQPLRGGAWENVTYNLVLLDTFKNAAYIFPKTPYNM